MTVTTLIFSETTYGGSNAMGNMMPGGGGMSSM